MQNKATLYKTSHNAKQSSFISSLILNSSILLTRMGLAKGLTINYAANGGLFGAIINILAKNY